ncbi:hypothetical protein ACEZCY_16125 [Streptacidiphilus sp. N1-12]|uniref:Uncharacterized protein n=2 Tax=Streptacidiphilus alkalitolerans TaxID=3342712 RepID=A0ABV6WFD3_9ACTN
MAETSGQYGPDWQMPPPMLGAHGAGPAVIIRSERAVVATRQVLAFPTGIVIEVEAHGRDTWQDQYGIEYTDGLRFAVRFADGRTVRQNDSAGLRDGRGPMLHAFSTQSSGGGRNNSEDIQLSLWLWPLPPSGPVTLSCSWPRAGITDAGLVLDGDRLRAAAALAEPFWSSDQG